MTIGNVRRQLQTTFYAIFQEQCHLEALPTSLNGVTETSKHSEFQLPFVVCFCRRGEKNLQLRFFSRLFMHKNKENGNYFSIIVVNSKAAENK